MENFKYILSTVFVLALFGFAGYWAFSTIESGSTHVDNQKQKELTQENVELRKEVASLKKEVGLLESQSKKNETVQEVPETVVSTTPIKTTVSKYQDLINALQKMVDDNIFLKRKSQGSMVGTVQKFLNIYNNTSNKVDNDFGASTETAVKNFQKAQGLTANGEAGASTFLKMITWLKSH